MSIVNALEWSPVTRVRIWSGDVLLFEELLRPGQSAYIPKEIADERLEIVPLIWQGEGSLRVLVESKL